MKYRTVRNTLTITFLILLLPFSFAVNWVKVTDDIYGDSHSFYKTGLNSAGITLRVRNYNNVLGTGVLYRIDQVEANCDTQMLKRVKSVSYNKEGDAVDISYSSEYGPISYGTLGAQYYQGVCYVLSVVNKNAPITTKEAENAKHKESDVTLGATISN